MIRCLLTGLSISALLASTATASIQTPQSGPTDPRSIASPVNPEAAPIAAEDMVAAPTVGEFVWSTDDQWVYISTNLGGRFNIWKTKADGGWPIRVTKSEEAQGGMVALPGDRLLYLQDRAGDENYDIYMVSGEGGAPVNLSQTPAAAEQDLKPSPDARTIAFAHQKKGDAQRNIAVMDLETRAVRLLTHENEPDGYWSPIAWTTDGRTLIVNREKTALGGDAAIWAIDVQSGKATPITAAKRGSRNLAAGISADGRQIAVSSNEGSTQLRAGIYDIASKSYRWLAPTPWEQTAITLSPDRRFLLVQTWENARTVLSLVDMATYSERRLDLPPGVNTPNLSWRYAPGMEAFSHDSGSMLLSHSAANAPKDVRLVDVATGANKVIAQLAPASLSADRLPTSAVVTYKSYDGTLVSGILTIPFNAKRDASNPAIVMPHGGPTLASEDDFDARAAFLASHGYFVLRPNYRGSPGYGRDFQEAQRRDMGGGDIKDVIAAKNFLLSTGYIDASKTGITGASGGGWLTMLALGKHAGEFAAGVQVVGIADWYTFLERADPFVIAYIKGLMGDPVKDRAAYLSAAPITYIDKINVPLLSIMGRNDIRVPWQQAEQIDKALKVRGVTSDVIVYDDEGHDFVKQENILSELESTLGWFDRYLKRVPPAKP